MIQKHFERSPLKSSLTQNVRICDPNLMISHNSTNNESCLKSLLHHLINLRHLPAVLCDNVKNDFSNFLSEDLKTNKDKFISFDWSTLHVGDVYFNASIKHIELAFVVKIVFTLSHGNASVERSF